jgi:hypothetical protein
MSAPRPSVSTGTLGDSGRDVTTRVPNQTAVERISIRKIRSFNVESLVSDGVKGFCVKALEAPSVRMSAYRPTAPAVSDLYTLAQCLLVTYLLFELFGHSWLTRAASPFRKPYKVRTFRPRRTACILVAAACSSGEGPRFRMLSTRALVVGGCVAR